MNDRLRDDLLTAAGSIRDCLEEESLALFWARSIDPEDLDALFDRVLAVPRPTEHVFETFRIRKMVLETEHETREAKLEDLEVVKARMLTVAILLEVVERRVGRS